MLLWRFPEFHQGSCAQVICCSSLNPYTEEQIYIVRWNTQWVPKYDTQLNIEQVPSIMCMNALPVHVTYTHILRTAHKNKLVSIILLYNTFTG